MPTNVEIIDSETERPFFQNDSKHQKYITVSNEMFENNIGMNNGIKISHKPQLRSSTVTS